MFSIFGCFKKKTAQNDIAAWLETCFPGGFEVVHSNVSFNVMDMYYSKKTVIVAEIADPEGQPVLN